MKTSLDEICCGWKKRICFCADHLRCDQRHGPVGGKEKIPQASGWKNFRGLVNCGGCGGKIVFSTREGRKSLGSFCCNTHRRYRGKECSTHYITPDQIKQQKSDFAVLEEAHILAGEIVKDK